MRLKLSSIALAICTLVGPAEHLDAQPIESPRLAALHAELQAGSEGAVATFWSEAAEQGTPLVEPLEGDQVLATFLWRETEPLEHVVVIGGPAGGSLRENMMTKLPGSDVWYRSYRVRSDLRTTYRLSPNDSLVPFAEVEDFEARIAEFRADPLNPKTFVFPPDPEDPDDVEMVLSLIELADAPPQPWIEPRANRREGTLENHEIKSDILDNERTVTVYRPPGYDADRIEPYPLLVLFDRQAYLHVVQTPVILDNLIHAGKIPPLVTVLVGNVNRSEELPCYEPFADFLAHELVPWVRETNRVTSDASRTIVAGSSYGGLASTFAAVQHPDVFGNVLSQSGSYWWTGPDDPEHEWLTRHIVDQEPSGIRFYMDVGLLESGPTPNNGPSQLVTNRHMRDVLRAKGYSVTYRELESGHDYVTWRGTLADGLIALMGEEKRESSSKAQSRSNE